VVPETGPASPPSIGEGRTPPNHETAPLARNDLPDVGKPKPVVAPRALSSRAIYPQVSLPGPAANLPDARQHTRETAASIAHTPPDVHITIGRVEIRAAPPPVPARTNGQPAPRLSLDAYLKQTSGGGR
jgi:hypothetical protein